MQPTLVFLPGESHGQRSLWGYRPQYRKKSDTTAVTRHGRTGVWASHSPRGETSEAQGRTGLSEVAGLDRSRAWLGPATLSPSWTAGSSVHALQPLKSASDGGALPQPRPLTPFSCLQLTLISVKEASAY